MKRKKEGGGGTQLFYKCSQWPSVFTLNTACSVVFLTLLVQFVRNSARRIVIHDIRWPITLAKVAVAPLRRDAVKKACGPDTETEKTPFITPLTQRYTVNVCTCLQCQVQWSRPERSPSKKLEGFFWLFQNILQARSRLHVSLVPQWQSPCTCPAVWPPSPGFQWMQFYQRSVKQCPQVST